MGCWDGWDAGFMDESRLEEEDEEEDGWDDDTTFLVAWCCCCGCCFLGAPPFFFFIAHRPSLPLHGMALRILLHTECFFIWVFFVSPSCLGRSFWL